MKAMAKGVGIPDRAFSLEAGSAVRINARQEDERASLRVPELEERMPVRQWVLELELGEDPGLSGRTSNSRPEPFQMRAARRLETGD